MRFFKQLNILYCLYWFIQGTLPLYFNGLKLIPVGIILMCMALLLLINNKIINKIVSIPLLLYSIFFLVFNFLIFLFSIKTMDEILQYIIIFIIILLNMILSIRLCIKAFKSNKDVLQK